MNNKINDTLDWYQARIGSYDKQLWEQSLEKKLFKNNLYCITKHSNKVQDFIDIDLIKGSTFSKAKSNFSLTYVMIYGVIRLIFYPLYINWWKFQIGNRLALCLFVLYIVQISNIITYYLYNDIMYYKHKQIITIVEILTPSTIMLILGIMYTYITSTLPTSCDYDKNNLEDHKISQLHAFNMMTNGYSSDEDDDDANDDDDDDCYISNDHKVNISINDLNTSDNINIQNSNNNNDCDSNDSTYSTLNSKIIDPIEFWEKLNKTKKVKNLKKCNNNNNNYLRAQSLNLSAVKERISCIIWDKNEWKGADLSMLEISNSIIINAKNEYLGLDYFYVGIVFSFIITLTPIYFYNSKALIFDDSATTCKYNKINNKNDNKYLNCTLYSFWQQYDFSIYIDKIKEITSISFDFWLNLDYKIFFILINTLLSTIILCILFFSLLAIAERTLKQRLLNAKYFCYLTSNRKARKHNLPHFRLSRVENVKTWLSVRSYMKKRGPQRSINAIISATFLIGVVLCSIVCIQFLRDSDFLVDNLFNWQLVIWCLLIWTFIIRFMTVGFKINKKYHNCMSIVIMEQINLYLQIEKLSEKKDELTIVNNVLKLAADLLKEIEKPFRISGLSVNPWIYNITKVVILSAFSAVLSELFGFKLKLHKIKIS